MLQWLFSCLKKDADDVFYVKKQPSFPPSQEKIQTNKGPWGMCGFK